MIKLFRYAFDDKRTIKPSLSSRTVTNTVTTVEHSILRSYYYTYYTRYRDNSLATVFRSRSCSSC